MTGRTLKTILVISLLTAGLTALLFADQKRSAAGPEWLRSIFVEIQAACRDAGTQWMVVFCLASYFVTFLFLDRRLLPPQKVTTIAKERTAPPASGFRPPNSTFAFFSFFRGNACNPDFWLVVFLTLVLLRYAFDYANAARSLQVVVLLTGMVVGKGIALWVKRPEHSASNNQQPTSKETPAPSSIFHPLSSFRPRAVITILTLLLACAALWQPERGMDFQYRGLRRWSGAWDNPNIYGLLMGVGTILAVGLFVQRLKTQSRGNAELPTSNFQRSTFNFGGVMSLVTRHSSLLLLLLIAGGLCAYGLIKSYSRGAWLGAAVGMGFLLWKFFNCEIHQTREKQTFGLASISGRSCVSWLNKNWLPVSVILASVLVLSFWHFRHTEQPVVRRAFSVGNVNDFSWRNRVAAWEGALAMMADRPVLGFGWNRPEQMYDHAYRPVRLEESAAVQLNDYFTLGMSLGVPALLCFGIYLWLVLSERKSQRSESETLNDGLWPLDWQQAVCCAGCLGLLVGFWFDGGLFKLPIATVFGVLLELALCRSRGDEARTSCVVEGSVKDASRRPLPLGRWQTGWPWRGIGLIGLALLCGLFWAAAREPLRRDWFSVVTPGQPRTDCLAVRPKSGGPFPVVIWSHGAGGDLSHSVRELRQIAEQGVAAVCFEYDKSSQEHFNAQMRAVLKHVRKQSWAGTNRAAWLGNSLGAQRQLSCALKNPDIASQTLVRLNGGWVSELDTWTNAPILNPSANTRRNFEVWMIHGENDEIFPVADARRVAAVLERAGAMVRLDTYPGRGHGFGADQPLLVRAAAEFCAVRSGRFQPVPVNVRDSSWYYWLPLGVALAWVIVAGWQRRELRALSPKERWLRRWGGILAVLAVLLTLANWLVPKCKPGGPATAWVRSQLVRPEWREDFDWLLRQPAARAVALGDLRQHLELAAVQSQFVVSPTNAELRREFVLSPWITGSGAESGWRRALWEHLQPRTRRETIAENIAEIVTRELRLRIAILDGKDALRSISEIWRNGQTDESGFEVITVAALRAAGIPARLSSSGHAEYWNGTAWKPAPRPMKTPLRV